MRKKVSLYGRDRLATGPELGKLLLARMRALALLSAVLLVVGGGTALAGGSSETLAPRTAAQEILVSPEWVAERTDEITVLEIGRDSAAFEEGHVPGAAFVPGNVIVAERDGVSGLLPEPDTVAADLASLGVSNGTPVVVYDGGASIWASRLFWALEYLGHKQVHLLDGGLASWEQADLALSQDVATPSRGEFTARVQDELLAEQEYVESNLDNNDVLILDARSPAEYRGEDVRAARGGHVPGAVNLEWTNNTQADNPRFRPIAELAEVYEQATNGHDGEVVTLCQAGFRAAHSYVALRILGYEEARMYDGSWSEWGNDEDAPIETGA